MAKLYRYNGYVKTMNSHPTQIPWQNEPFPAHANYPFKKLVLKRLFAENMLLFLLQYTGLTLATLTAHPTPIWFAPGVACAFIFMRGYTILPGIFLGGCCAYWLMGATSIQTIACTSAFTLQTGLLLALSYRYSGPTLIFYDRKPYLTFILFSAIITAITSFCLTTLCLEPLYHSSQFLTAWLHGWLANMNSLWVFSFAIVTFDYYFAEWDKVFKLNKSLIFILYGFLTVLAFVMALSSTLTAIIFIMPCLLLTQIAISRRLGWCGAIYSIFITGMIISLTIFVKPYGIDGHLAKQLSLQCGLLISSMIAIYIAIMIR